MAVTIGGTTGITIPSTATNQSGAVAWVNFNGVTTATIRTSYNVGSVTRTGTGAYTINFTNALADANYCITGTCGSGNVYGNYGIANRGNGSNTTTTCAVNTFVTNTGSVVDTDLICVAIFR
jgi:hypothetical protein